jgi:uncharacterized surface protein with fasciclin (FAS1) repeats
MRKLVLLFVALMVLSIAVMPAMAQEPTIADIVVNSASGNPAVQAADPSILAALSDPSQNLTVFAPTDRAFERLFAQLGVTPADVLANQPLLNEILLYHVLPARYNATALFQRANAGYPFDYIRTLQGTFVEFTNDNGSLIVDNAWVRSANINASNGIVHVIARVLLPSFNFGESGLSAFLVEKSATLSGANEVAPVVGDPDGTGSASVSLYPSRGQICWSFSTRNIDTITMAHIHRGAAGVNGPVVIDFNPVANGNAGCTSANSALLREIAGNPAGFYVNVHTVALPRGAVRGQLG